MRKLNDNEKQVIQDCLMFFKTFYMRAANLNGNDAITMNSEEKAEWTRFHSLLVATNIIYDDRFYCPNGVQPNLGIGNDGVFTKSEYVNILYQLVAMTKIKAPKEDPLQVGAHVLACIHMLEPYVLYFVNSQNKNAVIKLSPADLDSWNTLYFPTLVATGVIIDGKFFNKNANQAIDNAGIGKDGQFTCAELQHFLFQCHNYLID